MNGPGASGDGGGGGTNLRAASRATSRPVSMCTHTCTHRNQPRPPPPQPIVDGLFRRYVEGMGHRRFYMHTDEHAWAHLRERLNLPLSFHIANTPDNLKAALLDELVRPRGPRASYTHARLHKPARAPTPHRSGLTVTLAPTPAPAHQSRTACCSPRLRACEQDPWCGVRCVCFFGRLVFSVNVGDGKCMGRRERHGQVECPVACGGLAMFVVTTLPAAVPLAP